MSSFKIRQIRRELWKKNPKCFVCLEKIENYDSCSIEHVIPKSHGGTNERRNLAISHRICNTWRGNITCRLMWENNRLPPCHTTKNSFNVTKKTKAIDDSNFKSLVRMWKMKLQAQFWAEQAQKKKRKQLREATKLQEKLNIVTEDHSEDLREQIPESSLDMQASSSP